MYIYVTIVNVFNFTAAAAAILTAGTSLAPNDMELMQIMMTKIKNTEAKCAQLQSQLDVKVIYHKSSIKIEIQFID